MLVYGCKFWKLMKEKLITETGELYFLTVVAGSRMTVLGE
jgi:hypothetical protein